MANDTPDAARAREILGPYCRGLSIPNRADLFGRVTTALRAARADEREACLGAFSTHRKLGDKTTRCLNCDGWGWWVKQTHDGEGAMIECMVCDGTGHVVEELPAAIRARGQQA